MKQQKKQQAIDLLLEKSRQLGRLPAKQDFTNSQVVQIKGALGPWPRALEQAGLKESLPKGGTARAKKERQPKGKEQQT